MAYSKNKHRNEKLAQQDNYLTSNRNLTLRKPEASQFYEFEPGIVLDVILDENHPEFKNKTLDADDYPPNADGSSPSFDDPNFSWIGRAKIRLVYSQNGTEKELLGWIQPLENTGITEVPLVNEVVAVVRYFNTYYYTRKLNLKSMINANADINLERVYGLVDGNHEEDSIDFYKGPQSELAANKVEQINVGAIGRYFKFNHKIRALQRFEGDTIVESRFGSSIRFGAYDDSRKNDSGLNDYSDFGGNPMVLIRNRQTPITTISGNPAKFNKGYVVEDINKDGSSIQITSGKTITKFVPTISTSIFQSKKTSEQSIFTPKKITSFEIPVLDGDQIVINSDRLIFSSKAGETLHYSKKRYAISTDEEYTVDSKKQMVFTSRDKYTVDVEKELILTSNTVAAINAPKLYLGEHGDVNEPVLLGRTTALWLNTLCNFMINNIDIQIGLAQTMRSHTHISESGTTGTSAEDSAEQITSYIDSLVSTRTQLEELRDTLPSTMSRRVFTVGGGGALGKDGK
jgi:hypothetical protein